MYNKIKKTKGWNKMKKVAKYAVVGCGGFGNAHLDALCHFDNIEVIALCDIHIEKCYERNEHYKFFANCYSDYREMLEKESPDIVLVATSDQSHAEVTIAALRAGFHVMCEKPMALDLNECVDMVKASEESGKLLMIGQICRYTPGFAKAKDLVDRGIIGDLYYVESEYAHDYKDIRGVDEWRVTPEREPIIGGACHAIDLLRWIAGDPNEVFAYSNHKVLTDWPINDTTIAVMKFPNNVIGKIFTSVGCKRDYTMRTCLYGTKGTIIVNNTDPFITLYLEKIDDSPFAAGQLPEISEKTVKHIIGIAINNHNAIAEHKQMLEAVWEGEPLVTTGVEGARTVAVCRAVVEAAKNGLPVKVNYPV